MGLKMTNSMELGGELEDRKWELAEQIGNLLSAPCHPVYTMTQTTERTSFYTLGRRTTWLRNHTSSCGLDPFDKLVGKSLHCCFTLHYGLFSHDEHPMETNYKLRPLSEPIHSLFLWQNGKWWNKEVLTLTIWFFVVLCWYVVSIWIVFMSVSCVAAVGSTGRCYFN